MKKLYRRFGRDKVYSDDQQRVQLRISRGLNQSFSNKVKGKKIKIASKKYQLSKNLAMNVWVQMYLDGVLEIPESYLKLFLGDEKLIYERFFVEQLKPRCHVMRQTKDERIRNYQREKHNEKNQADHGLYDRDTVQTHPET